MKGCGHKKCVLYEAQHRSRTIRPHSNNSLVAKKWNVGDMSVRRAASNIPSAQKLPFKKNFI